MIIAARVWSFWSFRAKSDPRRRAVGKKFKNKQEKKKKQKKRKTTQALREIMCAYNKKILDAFRISELRELNILGPWKRSEKLLTFVLQ